jgi:predicted kinase
MNAKHAFLTIGLPASGKSTWAKNKAQAEGFKVFDLDDYRERLGNRHDQGLTRQAVDLRDRELIQAVNDGLNVIISDTNLNPVFRDEMVVFLTGRGYRVFTEVFDTPFEVCCERNNARANPVPVHAMERMRDQLAAQFPSG